MHSSNANLCQPAVSYGFRAGYLKRFLYLIVGMNELGSLRQDAGFQAFTFSSRDERIARQA
jgi:hypothetical protein